MVSANCPASEAGIKSVVSVYVEEMRDLDPQDVLDAIVEIRRGEWEFGESSRWLSKPVGGAYAPRIAELRHIAAIKSDVRNGKRLGKPSSKF